MVSDHNRVHTETPGIHRAQGIWKDRIQVAKEARSKELAKARYEKRKQDKQEFTVRKKAGLLTPEEQETEEKRIPHNQKWQKEWREKRKASEPEKSPKQKSMLAAHRRKKTEQLEEKVS